MTSRDKRDVNLSLAVDEFAWASGGLNDAKWSAVTVEGPSCASSHSTPNKVGRVLWRFVWALLFRPTPKILHAWRRFLLRLFGASIGRGVHVHPSVRVWAPWNLEMEDHSCLGPDVDCYCVDRVRIGTRATVSQYSFLCTATHDFSDADMPLMTAPIVINDAAWVAADVFIAPGVNVGTGAVIGARSSVFKDVEPWTIVVGSPAKFLKPRNVKTAGAQTVAVTQGNPLTTDRRTTGKAI